MCLAQNARPDIAIFDVRLAGRRDGIEGATLLRQQSGLPVVFVTGRPLRFRIEESALGASRGRCNTIRTDPGKSGGNPATSERRDSTPPAEAPTAITSRCLTVTP